MGNEHPVPRGLGQRTHHPVTARVQRRAPAQPGRHPEPERAVSLPARTRVVPRCGGGLRQRSARRQPRLARSEEHTSELQSQSNLVCRLLLEKKKRKTYEVTKV